MRGSTRRACWRRAILLVALVGAGGIAGPLAASAGGTPASPQAPANPLRGPVESPTMGAGPPSTAEPVQLQEEPLLVNLQDQPDADATVTRIALHENGSATWTIEIRTRLESGDDVDRYETFQEEFRQNRSRFRSAFEERISGVVENANRSIDRPMDAEAFAAETVIEEAPQRWGVVRYRFRWSGFAAGGDGRLVVGDVFRGNFFIQQNSLLVIVLPEGYDVTTAEPEPDGRGDRTLEWEGPISFSSGTPRVVAEEPGGNGVGPGLLLLGGGGLLAVLLLGGAIFAWRRGLPAHGEDHRGGPGAATEETERRPQPPPDSGPVTDEERVRHVLEANGGRCKQSAIVEELEWSKSKTSRVLSRMAEDEAVEKLRIGRENVIELPDDET